LASKVENAVGTAMQYMPNEKNVYQGRLLGVQQNWNVTVERDDDYGNVAKALGALGIAVGNNALEKEKQDYEVAQALAPSVFYEHDAKQRRTLDAVAMLANVGGYNLADNRYAVGVIDKLRGQYVAQMDYQDYVEWSKTQPLAKDANEENARYDKFMREREEAWTAENPDVIQNKYAYSAGRQDNAYERITSNIQDYHNNREQQNRQDFILGMQSKIDSLSRKYAYKDNIDPEEFHKEMMDTITSMNIAQSKHPEDNVSLIKYLYESFAKNTGNAELLDKIGEFQAYNGKLIKDILHPSTYKELSNAYADRMMNQLKVGDIQWADGFKSSVAIKEDFEKLQEDNPELALRRAPEYNRRYSQLKAQEEAELRQQARKTKVLGNEEMRSGRANSIIDNYLSGSLTGVPQSEKDLEAMGITVDDLTVAMKSRIDQLVQAGDDANIAKLARYPLFSKPVSSYFDQHLETDILRGEVTPALELAVKLAGTDGSYIEQAVGSKYADDILSLRILSDTFGMAEGVRMFAETKRRLSNADESRSINDELRYTSVPDFSVYDIGSESDSTISFNRDTLPYAMVERVDKISQVLRASGYTAEQARAMSMEAVKQQYVSVNGILMPSTDYHKIDTAIPQDQPTNVSLSEVVSYYTGYGKYPATWVSDGSQVYLRVDENGSYKRIFLDKIINDTQWYADNYKPAEKTVEQQRAEDTEKYRDYLNSQIAT